MEKKNITYWEILLNYVSIYIGSINFIMFFPHGK